MIAFLGIFAVLLLTFDLLSATERFRGVFATLTDSSDYEEGAEREVAAYLAKSRTPGSYTKLLVGDSVCAQMTEAFFDCNQQYCLVGNNRALTMAGEYLLVKEFLETHENVSEVWLMTGPDLLQTSIEVPHTAILMWFFRFCRRICLANLTRRPQRKWRRRSEAFS